MKKALLFLIVIAPFIGFAQALSGNYIIGTGQPFPFNTLTNAVTKINTVGIAAPVTFLLDNTEYSNATGETFPIKISQFAGTSAVNTLKIKPNVGKTVTIIANPNGTGYMGIPATIQFEGADNVTIDGSNSVSGTTKDLTITNNDNIGYMARAVLWISSNGSNGSVNVAVTNTKVRITVRNQEQLLFTGIFSGSNSLGTNNALAGSAATAGNSQTNISNNEFINVRQAIYINGSGTASQQTNSLTIASNVMGSTADVEKPSLGLYLSNISNFNITDNVINGVLNNSYSNMSIAAMQIENGSNYTIKRNTVNDVKLTTNAILCYAILLKGNHSNAVISENRISNVKNTGNGIVRAVYIEIEPTIVSGMLLANNFISDVTSNGTSTNSGSGLYLASGRSIKIYNNSIALTTGQPGISAAAYISGGSELDVRNNIFVNSSTTGTPYAFYSSVGAAAYSFINYNDYHSQIIGYLGGNRNTLANWKAATGKDVNSVNILPVFTSATDLHLVTSSNSTLDNLGAPLANVTVDIDQFLRSSTVPDIGADEFFTASVLAAQPTIQSSAVNFTNVTNASFTVNWTNGNGARRIVLIRSTSAVNAAPEDGMVYNANAVIGTGNQIGTGNFAVYAGTASSIVVTGLTASTLYHVAVYEYNGVSGSQNYLTTTPAVGSRTTQNAVDGWQIPNLNTLNTLTFDTTTQYVNVGAFQGNGITFSPVAGQLNSNAWSVTGFNAGAVAFGGSNDDDTFNRGTSTGGVSQGGIYAFNTSAGNAALGIKPATGDFSPGSVSLRFQNQTGATITSLSVGYKVYVYNNENASSSFNFSHSGNNTTYTDVSALSVVSTGLADSAPTWKASYRVATITGISIPANSYYYFRWSGATVSGNTAFDEFALDDIQLSANPSTNFAVFNGTAEDFKISGNTGLSGNTTINGNTTISAGKLTIGSSTLTLNGGITNTVMDGLKGSATSNITIGGSINPSLSFDQTVVGTTNLLNNLTLGFGPLKTVTILNPVVINGALSISLDQTLNMGSNALTGTLAAILVNGTLRTQNTTASPIPTGKTWGGTGTISYDAISSAQTLVSGTYNHLTSSSTGGANASGALTVNGVLHLPQPNPSATAGSLALGSNVLTMGADGTNTGIGDVTGITTRNAILPNILYTFGHEHVSIIFPAIGTLPTSMSLKTMIGMTPSFSPGSVNRMYDFIQTGGSGTKAVIKSHYLDSELNGNIENKLVDFAHIVSSNTSLEQGRSNFSTSENWIELTNVNVGLYFSSSFNAVHLTFDESSASFLTWNGSVSDSWTTATNWTPNATPSDNTVAVIPNASTTPNDPLLNPATLLGSLSIEVGGILNSPNNAQFTINNGAGAWINNGIFNPGGGTSRVIFKNLDATMAGTTSLNHLTIDAGAGIRPLTDNLLRIAGTFNLLGLFPAGSIENTVEYTGTNQVIVTPTGPLTAYNNLKISGTGAVFPASLNIAGNLTLQQPVDFTDKAITFNGAVPQIINGSSPAVFSNLTINNGEQVLISANTTVGGTLNLASGNLVLGSNTLTLGSASILGTFGVTNMIVAEGAGIIKRPFAGVGSYFFPIGEKTGNTAYSPIIVDITSGTFAGASVSVSLVDAIHPNNQSLQNYISRYWKVSQTGISNAVANITANYITPELLAPANTMVAAQLIGNFNQQTNPWIRYQALNNLTLTAAGASLPAGQTSYFTGIKGGEFNTLITGGGNFCRDEPVILKAFVTGGDAGYTYSWSGGLGTEPEATPSTATLGTVLYTVTIKDANGITTTASASVTVQASAGIGTISANQTVCFGSVPNPITLTGNTGTLTYWERSENAEFSNPIIINVTTNTLNGTDAGVVTANTYFRAALSNGACPVVFSTAILVSVRSTVWNGSSWSNGAPDSTTSAVITGNYSESQSINACSLTVVGGAVVTIPSGFDVVLNGPAIVDQSSLLLENNSNLEQTTDDQNTGTVIIKRSTSPLFRLDYSMWGSPVTGSQTLHAFSPQTVDNRFYTLNTTTGLFSAIDPNANTFSKGAGFLIRTPNNHVAYSGTATPAAWLGTFTGTPINGPVSVPLDNSGTQFNMVSNPYPSLLDADAFLDINQADISGTIYFWRRRNNAPVAGELISAYYATYTTAGGTGVEPLATASVTSEIPNGFIQVGQGFLVSALASPATGNVSFNNQMRSVADNSGQFFRTNELSRSRIWMNLTNNDGAFSQTLLAYMEGAENGIDRADGKYMNDGTFAFSSYLDNEEYIIQGRAPFEASDVVQMNFKTPTAGSYTIAIDHTDGLFDGEQDIFLRDKLVNVDHNLKLDSYTFSSEAGNFNDRFEMIYQAPLSTNNPAVEAHAVVYKQAGDIVINTGTAVMHSVKVFDIRGRLLIERMKINSSDERINADFAQQVLIIRITLDNNSIITRKILN